MMQIKVVFFASFKEVLGVSEIQQALEEGACINDLCKCLSDRGEQWQDIFDTPSRTVKVACNQQMAEISTVLQNGDEVAFFPPVTGG